MTIIQAQTAKWFLLTYDGGRNFTEFCIQATGVCGYVCVCVCTQETVSGTFFFLSLWLFLTFSCLCIATHKWFTSV